MIVWVSETVGNVLVLVSVMVSIIYINESTMKALAWLLDLVEVMDTWFILVSVECCTIVNVGSYVSTLTIASPFNETVK